MRILECLAAIAMLPAVVAAQSPVAGQWKLNYTRAFRNLHTNDTTIVDESGLLSLHIQADSVSGFWQTETRRDEPAAPVRAIHGTARGDTVRVQFDSPVHSQTFLGGLGEDIVEWMKTHIHDMPTTVPSFELVVRGDSISGTRRTVTLQGEARGPAVKVSGSRAAARK